MFIWTISFWLLQDFFIISLIFYSFTIVCSGLVLFIFILSEYSKIRCLMSSSLLSNYRLLLTEILLFLYVLSSLLWTSCTSVWSLFFPLLHVFIFSYQFVEYILSKLSQFINTLTMCNLLINTFLKLYNLVLHFCCLKNPFNNLKFSILGWNFQLFFITLNRIRVIILKSFVSNTKIWKH